MTVVGGSLSQKTFWQRFLTSQYSICQNILKRFYIINYYNIILNTIIIGDMIHFLNIFTQKWRPRQLSGLPDWAILMEILLKNDGMQNCPKSQTWDFIKRRIPGNLGGMGMVSMVVPYLIWYYYQNPCSIRWDPHPLVFHNSLRWEKLIFLWISRKFRPSPTFTKSS